MSASAPQDASFVATAFVAKYYDVLEKFPEYMNRFYKEGSTFTIHDMADEQTTAEAVHDVNAIQEKVMQTVHHTFTKTQHVDAQFSMNGSVLLQVTGAMKIRGVDRRFAQTFFLAPQEHGYYVMNDLLRVFPPEPQQTRPAENGYPYSNVPGFTPNAVGGAIVAQPPAAPSVPAQQDYGYAASTPAPAPAPSAQAPPAPAAAPAPAPVETVEQAAPQPETAVPVTAPAPAPEPAVTKPAPAQPRQPAPAPAPAPPVKMTWAQRAAAGPAAAARPAPSAPSAAPFPAAPVAEPEPAQPAAVPAGHDEAPAAEPQEPQVQATPAPAPVGVFVKFLPDGCTEEQLREEFSKFGAISTSKSPAVYIKNVGPNKGPAAYVHYEEEASVEAAMKASVTINGKKVTVLRMLPDLVRGGQGGRGMGRGPMRGGMFRGGRGGFPEGGRGGRGGERLPRGDREGSRRPPAQGPAGPGGRGSRGGRSSGGGRREEQETKA